MKTLNVLLTAVATLVFAAEACAELKWESKEIELKPGLNDTSTVARFKFENSGPNPVNITSVKSTCGCTVASLKSNKIAPGEKGEITATFNIGNRTGVQQKAIYVQTDDPANANITLMLKAVIPSLLEVQPKLVYWDGKEPLKPKTITVTAPKDSPVTDVAVTSSTPDFTTKIDANRGAKEWKISIVPKDAAQNRNATLTIKPDQPNPPKLYYAVAKVAKSETAVAPAATDLARPDSAAEAKGQKPETE